jgi:hypothetical protein
MRAGRVGDARFSLIVSWSPRADTPATVGARRSRYALAPTMSSASDSGNTGLRRIRSIERSKAAAVTGSPDGGEKR